MSWTVIMSVLMLSAGVACSSSGKDAAVPSDADVDDIEMYGQATVVIGPSVGRVVFDAVFLGGAPDPVIFSKGPCRVMLDVIHPLYYAGDVRFAVGSLDATLTWNGDYYDSIVFDSVADVGPGDTVMVSATGGDVPAFSGEVVIPRRLQASLPAEGSSISKSTPLTVTWTPADPGSTTGVGLAQPGQYISCGVPDEEGRIVIDVEVLAYLYEVDTAIGVGRSRSTRVPLPPTILVDIWASTGRGVWVDIVP